MFLCFWLRGGSKQLRLPYRGVELGAGKMAQCLCMLIALAEDQGSATNTHVRTHEHLGLQFQESRCPLWISLNARHIHTHTGKIPTQMPENK